MFVKFYTYLFVLAAIITCYSCRKDLGNYDYHTINTPTTYTGIKDTTATYGSRFIMKPQVSFSEDSGQDTTKYSYEWAYIGPTGVGGSAIYVMATTRYLDINVNLVAGNYPFYYGITDKKTGVKYRKNFVLTVINPINEGWLLMCDVSGQARLDMLSSETAGFRTIIDLLATTGSGLVLKGKPNMVYCYNTGTLVGAGINLPFGVYVGTTTATNRLDPETFKWQNNYNVINEMFGDEPDNFYADVVKKSGSTRSYLLGNGNVYLFDRTNQIKYSVPLNYITAEKKAFKIAPFIATNEVGTTAIAATFYDMENRRFVRHTGTVSACNTLVDPSAGRLFSYSTGMDMLYMTYVPFNGGEVSSILKDPASAKRYLARFSAVGTAQNYYAEINATDFANADSYAISPDLPYLFYSVGGKLYEYDMSLKTTKLMMDKGSKRISHIKFHPFQSTTKYTNSNKLIICSYDPALPEGTNGAMEMYTVPPINADLVMVASYSGFGKVQSLTYRER